MDKDFLEKEELNRYFELKKKLASGIKGQEYVTTLGEYMKLKEVAINYMRNKRNEIKNIKERMKEKK